MKPNDQGALELNPFGHVRVAVASGCPGRLIVARLGATLAEVCADLPITKEQLRRVVARAR